MSEIMKQVFLLCVLCVWSFGNPGFFQIGHQGRPFPEMPTPVIDESVVGSPSSEFVIDFADSVAPILSTLFGNNANFYLYGLEKDSAGLAHLKAAGIKNLRLPGGNASNSWLWDGEIHWELWEDYGSEVVSAPTKPSNVQTFDQMALADSIGAMPQPCVNVALARYIKGADSIAQAAAYAAEWVRELNVKQNRGVKYWEVGNENYGSWVKGYEVNGQKMTGAMYGKMFNAFADSMKAVDPSIKIGAVVYEGETNPWTGEWNQELLPVIQDHADYLVVHQYFTWAQDYNDVTVEEVIGALPKIGETIELLYDHVEAYTEKERDHFPVAMTEYNVRAGRKNSQQISAVFNAMALGEYVRYGYGLVNIWDVANAFNEGEDHGMLTRKDPNRNDYNPNPSFYAYFLANRVFGESLIKVSPEESQGVRVYPSRFSTGELGVLVVNSGNEMREVSLDLRNFSSNSAVLSYHLTASGPEEREVLLNGQSESSFSGPLNYKKIAPRKKTFTDKVVLRLQPYSVNAYFFPKGEETTNRVNDPKLFTGKEDVLGAVLYDLKGEILPLHWQGGDPQNGLAQSLNPGLKILKLQNGESVKIMTP